MGAAVKGRSPRPLTSVCQLTESHSHATLAAPRMFQSLLLFSGLGDNLGPLPYLNAMIHVQGPRFNIYIAPAVYSGTEGGPAFRSSCVRCMSYCLRPFEVKVFLVTAIKDHLTSARIPARSQLLEILCEA